MGDRLGIPGAVSFYVTSTTYTVLVGARISFWGSQLQGCSQLMCMYVARETTFQKRRLFFFLRNFLWSSPFRLYACGYSSPFIYICLHLSLLISKSICSSSSSLFVTHHFCLSLIIVIIPFCPSSYLFVAHHLFLSLTNFVCHSSSLFVTHHLFVTYHRHHLFLSLIIPFCN